MKKGTILLYLFFICIVGGGCQEFAWEPWGPWNTYPLDERVVVVRTYKSERFYQNGHGGIWIREDHYDEGELVPAIAEDGAFNEIERYEQTDYGYLFYLVGHGIRDSRPLDGRSIIKRNMRMQVKMIFIDRDTCRFEFISLYDEEGVEFVIGITENEIYHRYRVEDE